MEFVIVSGLSGSGKSIALQALEDIGYYVIDNLPAILLPQFGREMLAQEGDGIDKAAVSIDSRNGEFLKSLNTNLDALSNLGLDYKILFLEADESILVKRYKETRRKHPLTNNNTSLMEGIAREKEQLLPLAENAAMRIDTTYRTPHELRRLVRSVSSSSGEGGLMLLFESFGYKHGTPVDADFVFDVRCLPNPHWEPDLKNLTGLDQPVRDFLKSHNMVNEMVNNIREFVERWLPAFEKESRSYVTVAIGCTGGQHRSVYTVDLLSSYFSKQSINVQTRHREMQ